MAMGALLIFYIVMTLSVSGFMLFDGMIWAGIALLIGALLGFAGGSGIRASFYLGYRKSGIIVGVGLLLAGMLLVFYSDVILWVFGVEFSGDVWVLLGFVLGFLNARPVDAGIEVDRSVAK